MDSKTKAALLILTAVAFALAALPAEDADAASGVCGDNVTWSLANGDLAVTGSGPMSNFEFGKAPWYLDRASIKTLTINGPVTSIGNYAFYGCSSLESLDLPRTTSVGFKAFANCTSLSEANLGGVKEIGGYAFYGCTGLSSITFSDSLSKIGTNAFGTVKFSAGSGSLSPTVSNLAGCQFVGSGSVLSLKADGLSVGEEFVSSGIRYKVTSLSPNQASVTGCLQGTTAIDVPESVLCKGTRFAVVSVDNQAFYNNSKIASIDLGGVKTIGFKAFANCTALRSADIDSVVSIGSYAFFGCTALSHIAFADGLSSVGTSAFSKIKFVAGGTDVIPAAKNLAGKEFSGIGGVLSEVQSTVGVGTTFSSDSVKYEIVSMAPRQVSVAGCESGTSSITIPGSVSYKGSSYSVVSVKDQAFYNNTAIQSVDLGGVESVGFKSFANCAFLETVKMRSVEFIGGYAFFGCTGLSSIEFSNDLKTIGTSAFSKVKFYSGSTELSAKAPNLAGKTFAGSSGFLYLNEAQVSIGTTFKADALICEVISLNPNKVALCGASVGARDIVVPDKVAYGGLEFVVTSVADQAFYNNKVILNVDLGSVETIGFKSFANCVFLETAKLGKVSSIGKYAFFGSTGLSSISFSSGLKAVESSSFGKISFYSDSEIVSATASNLAGKTFVGSGSVLYSKNTGITVGTVFSADGVQYKVISTSPLEVAVAGSALKNIVVPSEVNYADQILAVVSVADQAFYNNKVLESIDLGNVKYVGFKSFANCTSLRNVSLPMVESIGKYAFFGSTGLESIAFSDSLSSIGTSAFTKISFSRESQEITPTAENLAGKTFLGSSGVLMEKSSEIIKSCVITIIVQQEGFGTVTQSRVMVEKGTTVSSEGNNLNLGMTIVKALPSERTAQYTYVFSEWTIPSSIVNGDATITAHFARTINQYHIVWQYENGGIIAEDSLNWGEQPPVRVPARESDSGYAYVFVGWIPEIKVVTEDATYTAVFEKTIKDYNVNFINWNDEIVYSGTHHIGDLIVVPNVSRQGYTFIEWRSGNTSLHIGSNYYVDSDASFNAVFAENVRIVFSTDSFDKNYKAYIDDNGTSTNTINTYVGATINKSYLNTYRANFTFMGCYIDEKCTIPWDYTVKNDNLNEYNQMYVYMKWDSKSYPQYSPVATYKDEPVLISIYSDENGNQYYTYIVGVAEDVLLYDIKHFFAAEGNIISFTDWSTSETEITNYVEVTVTDGTSSSTTTSTMSNPSSTLDGISSVLGGISSVCGVFGGPWGKVISASTGGIGAILGTVSASSPTEYTTSTEEKIHSIANTTGYSDAKKSGTGSSISSQFSLATANPNDILMYGVFGNVEYIQIVKIDSKGIVTNHYTYNLYSSHECWKSFDYYGSSDGVDEYLNKYLSDNSLMKRNDKTSAEIKYEIDAIMKELGVSGSGSSNKPYLLKDAEDMRALGLQPCSHFKLANDIDMSYVKNWIPILMFNGELDGNGHTLYSLNITKDYGTNSTGLIEKTGKTSNIHDLTVQWFHTIIDADKVYAIGSLIGDNWGTLRNVTAKNCVFEFTRECEVERFGYLIGSTVEVFGCDAIDCYFTGVTDPKKLGAVKVIGPNDLLGVTINACSYVLVSDLDLSDVSNYISYHNYSFHGTLDGKDHTISNLNINVDYSLKKEDSYGQSYSGLFWSNHGSISNIRFVSPNLTVNNGTHSDFTSLLCGFNEGTINNIKVDSPSVHCQSQRFEYAGIVTALNKSTGTVSNCTINNMSAYVSGDFGGIVGINWGTLSSCTISGGYIDCYAYYGGYKNVYIGGVVGYTANDVSYCNAYDLDLYLNRSYRDYMWDNDMYPFMGYVVGYAYKCTVSYCYVDKYCSKTNNDVYLGWFANNHYYGYNGQNDGIIGHSSGAKFKECKKVN
ncbi:MAG: leucine-rich repeat protein [Candidatus Methanomethylophilaceae archaeon]|nr:leucine-rich repeat protein [Candidatus Methanomethylophilaceae archaeon]